MTIAQTATIDIALPAPHSDKQRQLITFPGNVVTFAGRRWGKTDGYVQRIFYWMQQEPGLYWWVGLTWRSASMKRAWRVVTEIARRVLRALGLDERHHINKSSHEVKIPGLGEIWFRTAENPESLAGEGIRGAVVDEFSLMQEIVWTEYLEATLLDYGGWAAFGGVPKGNNWAAKLWRKAADLDGWIQIHATTYENPHIDKAGIDAIRARLVEMLFSQEYLAKIVADAGGVFRRVMDAAVLTPLDGPAEGRRYTAGVDVADKIDYTVVSVLDIESREQVYLDRFQRVTYPVLEDRLAAIYERFKMAAMLVEDNSIGQGVIDHLHGRGLNIMPFHTSNITKHSVITDLASAFEHGEIKIIADPIQVDELQAFQGERLGGGGFRYGAPEGMHDDTVMALALAWSAVSDSGPVILW